ncbi:DEAD/DEAH box helicase [Caulobacter sp. S45]|jgi:superfamily II DNA/RNA helicase|uniref:DEAD/DEAH box helicase n=1 Tax=Caulobacter sp. S45 TaxID=1641861 RepID=UPI00131C6173|nr:DEAD/DEAH box helicase [Caulobacter sp. S45]
MTDFSQLGLRPETIQAVIDTGYTVPTPIQEQAIPVALAGRDVLGIAQTGTGKTAAFTLPMIDRLAAGRARARMPRSLVLAPTRELADQVASAFDKYAKGTKLTWALLIGGVSFDEQLKKLDRGVDVLIATPGRLLDHHERGKLLLTGVEIMVVDEADRMLDMGFIPDIERIFKLTPPRRQTLFFSATMPPEITRLTTQFLKDPTRIEVSRPASTADTISQYVANIPSADPKAKRTALRALISGADVKNAIVFCNRKSEVDIVAKSLARHGFDAAAIHGDLDQSQRTRTLESFRKGELTILVASDVAARGLDIPAVGQVFNYDVPHHADDYVHRIGRTGRAGRTGEAFMIVTPADAKNYEKVLKLTKKEPETVVLDLDWGGIEAASRDREPARGERGRGERSRSSVRAERGPRRERGARREAEPDSTVVATAGEGEQPDVDFGLLADELPHARPAPREESRSRPERDQPERERPEGAYGERAVPERERSRRERPERDAGGDRRPAAKGSERRPPRGESRESGVLGFGADTPAFLLRASPLPPKEAVELED